MVLCLGLYSQVGRQIGGSMKRERACEMEMAGVRGLCVACVVLANLLGVQLDCLPLVCCSSAAVSL